MMKLPLSSFVSAVALGLGVSAGALAACDDNGTMAAAGPPADAGMDVNVDVDAADAQGEAAPPLELHASAFGEPSNATIVRIFPWSGDGFIVLEESTEAPGLDFLHPRRVRWLRADGSELSRYTVANPDLLLDIAVHPSGDVSALVAGASSWFVHRLRSGVAVGAPGKIELSPRHMAKYLHAANGAGPENDDVFNFYTRNCGRLLAQGEEAVAAVRTGRNTVIAAAMGFAGNAWHAGAQSVVVPGVPMIGISIISGSNDVFGAIETQFHVFGDQGPDARPFFALQATTSVLGAFNIENLGWLNPIVAPSTDADTIVTRALLPEPTVKTAFVAGTRLNDEPTNLRIIGDAAYVVGRSGNQGTDGLGWDAFVSKGSVSTMDHAWAQRIHIVNGDIFFDIAEASGGRLLAIGSCDYAQNPRGASVSEYSQSCAVVLDANGRFVNRITIPNGPRHNELRSIVALGGDRFIVAGMTDGPGAHSADTDPALGASKGVIFLLEPGK